MNCSFISEILVVRIKCTKIYFFHISEESALCTWQFYILAADSSRPSTVQKNMMTWNVCLFIDLFVSVELYKKAALVFNHNLYEIIFKPNTLWDACTILSDNYKNPSSFVCFWFVKSFIEKTTMTFTLWIFYWLSYNPLMFNMSYELGSFEVSSYIRVVRYKKYKKIFNLFLIKNKIHLH